MVTILRMAWAIFLPDLPKRLLRISGTNTRLPSNSDWAEQKACFKLIGGSGAGKSSWDQVRSSLSHRARLWTWSDAANSAKVFWTDKSSSYSIALACLCGTSSRPSKKRLKCIHQSGCGSCLKKFLQPSKPFKAIRIIKKLVRSILTRRSS